MDELHELRLLEQCSSGAVLIPACFSEVCLNDLLGGEGVGKG